jgi:hypothetical protein
VPPEPVTPVIEEPDAEDPVPPVTRDDVFAVLNKQDSDMVKRPFEFETSTYKTKGNLLGVGKYDIGVKGNGTISLTLSSSRNVVINQTEMRISIAFGQTAIDVTTDPPDKWTYIAANDNDQEKADKNRDDFVEALEKKTGDKGWSKEVIAEIVKEIAEQRDTKAKEAKKIFEDDIRSSIINQLTQRYQIGDYAVEIFFDQ